MVNVNVVHTFQTIRAPNNIS